jgi:NADP-dependent 3-hydroxy acid dehydrogenase YdfG
LKLFITEGLLNEGVKVITVDRSGEKIKEMEGKFKVNPNVRKLNRINKG